MTSTRTILPVTTGTRPTVHALRLEHGNESTGAGDVDSAHARMVVFEAVTSDRSKP